MKSIHLTETQKTKKEFLVIVTGEYLITGFFWVFSTLGSFVLALEETDTARKFFFTMFILMLSNGIWEILTGWYADKFKRQFSMSAGFAACFLGFFLMGIPAFFEAPQGAGQRFFVWIAGVSIWSLGPALLSGAQEAWLVDRCNFFSQDPPEDFDAVFKRSAAYGIVAKSIGMACCFIIFFGDFKGKNFDVGVSKDSHKLVFGLSAGIAASLSAWLLYRSLRLREEYWSHPKYQTTESLFVFIGKGLHDLWKTSYRWFTLSYVGAMSLNYVVSSTVWPYLVSHVEDTGKPPGVLATKFLLPRGAALILAGLLGGFLSRPFSKWIDLIKQRWQRMPVASLMYLAPSMMFLFIHDSPVFLYILIGAEFSFRTVHASVFGSLNTIGQLAIKSDERRAILISLSSAISSFLMAVVFFVFYKFSLKSVDISHDIERFWRYVPLPCILILVWGAYMVTRPRPEGS